MSYTWEESKNMSIIHLLIGVFVAVFVIAGIFVVSVLFKEKGGDALQKSKNINSQNILLNEDGPKSKGIRIIYINLLIFAFYVTLFCIGSGYIVCKIYPFQLIINGILYVIEKRKGGACAKQYLHITVVLLLPFLFYVGFMLYFWYAMSHVHASF
jgi:flagellar basal body-associated protein FliL